VTKRFRQGDADVTALRGARLTAARGEFVAVMGASGSGKSTLLHVMAGLTRPDEGRVLVDGQDLSALSDRRLTLFRRRHIGLVFQAFNLIPTLTAAENIVLPLDLAGQKPDREWLDTVIDAVGLRDRLGHRPTELSGGQQQRVACARALASKPSIVFADEPTGNLDSTSGAEVLSFLRRSVDDFGQTVVMVTHDAVAASYCDRVVFLADGLVVDEIQDPQREQILEHMTRLQDLAAARATRA
jgi:putative ABC transport system ATP-binding protein